MKRVLVTGSRTWMDYPSILAPLMVLDTVWDDEITLVHGACPQGADAVAEIAADSLAWEVERHPAQWNAFGKSAGFRRNEEMVMLGADICIAYIDLCAKRTCDRESMPHGSHGARHCSWLAENHQIPTVKYKRWETA